MGGKGRGKRKKGGRKGREKGRDGEGREGGRLRRGFWGMDAPGTPIFDLQGSINVLDPQ